MFYINKSLNLIVFLILIEKIVLNVSKDTLFGDDCVCEGRCKECVVGVSHKLCRLCSNFYKIDLKNLGIDSSDKDVQRTCACPPDFLRKSHDNQTSSEIVLVKIECGVYPIDNQFCIGINPQIFLIGSNFAEYWIIIGSILSVVFILCCALYSLFKNNWCFSPENLLSIYGQNFPLSTMSRSRVNSINSLGDLDNCNDSHRYSTEIRSDSSHPPTYDEIFNISSNSNHNNTNSNSDKYIIEMTKSESNDVLPSYEDAVAIIKAYEYSEK